MVRFARSHTDFITQKKSVTRDVTNHRVSGLSTEKILPLSSKSCSSMSILDE